MRILTPLACVALAATAAAQSFSYPDFSSPTQLAMLGNAGTSGTALRLTANQSNQTGWAWRLGAMPVLAGFDTTFTFRITPPVGATKAEGMAFVVQDDPNGVAATGGTVWGIGYGNGANSAIGLRHSLALELDTYQDGFLGDTSANELTLHTRGAQGNHENEQWSLARNTPAAVLSDGQVHTLRLRYVPGLLEVFVDNATTPAISRAYDFTGGGLYANGSVAPGLGLANGTAFVGFCAATGGGTLTELVEILSWDWTSTPLVHPCYAGSLGEDVLRVQGSTGGPLREVALATWQPFSIDVASPTGFGPGAPYVLFVSFAPQPGAFGTQLGFGETCFPVLPKGPTEHVLADGFGLFPALLPAPPAPYSFALPAGVVTFPIDLTLQAVTLGSSNPLTIGVSNAVDVHFAQAPAPTIQSVTPLSAQPGQPVTVHGASFVPGCTLLVNGAPVTPSSITATDIVFAYPAGLACDAQLAVVNPDGLGATTALNPTPNVTGTLLGSGPAAGNAIFVVQGSGFSAGLTATIGGAPAIVLSVSVNTLTLRTPPGTPGVQPVVITTLGGCTTSTTYTYL